MPTYLSPGVYVEEVDRGSKPIEGVGTAVAAFVGFTARSPVDDPDDPDGIKPRLVTNWAQFESLYGGFVEGALLPHAVYGYFNNGGGTCYVCRIPHQSGGGGAPKRALASGAKGELQTLEVRALEAGGCAGGRRRAGAGRGGRAALDVHAEGRWPAAGRSSRSAT